jgi:ribose transport system substrate-binding protein
MEKSERRSSSGVESVLRACSLLRAFRYEGELLRLRDLVARTSLRKTTVHRLLHTLEEAGFVRRVGAESYGCCIKRVEHKRARIGFAAQTAQTSFASTVTESVKRAALENNVDLVMVDNKYSPKIALRNAEQLIRERVEVVLEFQTYETIAPIIAARFIEARIPVIAIEIPHPGAVFFGANNYQAGLIGGRALGRWAKANWDGRFDEVLLLEEKIAGPLPRLRVSGMLAGLREVLPAAEKAIVTTYDGQGSFSHSQGIVRDHVRKVAARRTLVCASNDPSALGALRAFEEAGLSSTCAVMGQNAVAEAREELRRRGTRLIGTVAYFPERYGDELLPLALGLVAGKHTPPAVFVKHQLVTAANVDALYPLENTEAVAAPSHAR